MAKTSIHLKGCNVAASECHNKREKYLNYVRQDLSHLNESYSYIAHSLPTELANIKRDVKSKTGRKLQKNAVPLKEGVIVIDNNTSMAQIQTFCDQCQQRFGMRPLQIHIHRDEGHVRAKEWRPNLHAHIVWSMYDQEGRNVRLSRQDCVQMQTMLAQCLQMERGKTSDKKHLEIMQYKIQEQNKQIEEQEMRIAEMQQEIAQLTQDRDSAIKKAEMALKGVAQGVAQGVRDRFTGKSRRRAEEAEREAAEAKEQSRKEVEIANQKVEEERKRADAEREKRKQSDAERDRTLENWKHNEKIIKDIDRWQRERDDAKDDKEIAETKYNQLNTLVDDCAEIGLSVAEMQVLMQGKALLVKSLKCGDNTITWEDGGPIQLKTIKGRLHAYFKGSWDRIKDFIKTALSNPWFAVNGVSNDRRSRGRKM